MISVSYAFWVPILHYSYCEWEKNKTRVMSKCSCLLYYIWYAIVARETIIIVLRRQKTKTTTNYRCIYIVRQNLRGAPYKPIKHAQRSCWRRCFPYILFSRARWFFFSFSFIVTVKCWYSRHHFYIFFLLMFSKMGDSQNVIRPPLMNRIRTNFDFHS